MRVIGSMKQQLKLAAKKNGWKEIITMDWQV
jgi:hypothetical protein